MEAVEGLEWYLQNKAAVSCNIEMSASRRRSAMEPSVERSRRQAAAWKFRGADHKWAKLGTVFSARIFFDSEFSPESDFFLLDSRKMHSEDVGNATLCVDLAM